MDKILFSWAQLGNVSEGRPNLGKNTRVEVYRMMQYSLRAALEAEYGDEKTRMLLVNAGRLAGKAFFQEMFDVSFPLNKFIAQLQSRLEELGIGILRLEKANSENMSFTLTMSEDLDCSGLPVNGVTVCDYDEGFLEGIFKGYTGKDFEVHEIDCWSTGERTCRFTINPC
jgi:uncharacterized protein